MAMKSKEYVRLSVTPETQQLVREACKKELLKHKPELEKFNITDDVIVDRIAKYYLDS